MKSYTKIFSYTKPNGNKSVREVFVLYENNEYVKGFDLKELSSGEIVQLKKSLKDHDVHNQEENAYKAANNLFEEELDKDFMSLVISKALKTFRVDRLQEGLPKTKIVELICEEGYGKGKKENVRRNLNYYLNKNYKKGLYRKYVVKQLEKDLFNISNI